jgi:hypothetical protein
MDHRREFAVVTYEENLNAVRERVFRAEEAMDAYIHSHRHDSGQCMRLAVEVSAAWNELLDQLAALLSAHWEFQEVSNSHISHCQKKPN